MKSIYLITDYGNRFGTKYTARPYRSGMDHQLLTAAFRNSGIEPLFINAARLASSGDNPAGKIYIYTSSEDKGGHYKSFLDNLVLSLESRGATVIPGYKFLKAHNNKVFMEMLRQEWDSLADAFLRSQLYGSLDELIQQGIDMEFPVVVKKPEGFKSRNVWLVNDMDRLMAVAGKISRSFRLKSYIFDRLRLLKYPGFTPESQHRRSFMVQQFVQDLTGDYKLLIYGDRYYPLLRQNRPGDFRASGSGLLSFPETLPDGLLDFCRRIFETFDVPALSLDVASDGNNFRIFEAQFVYFGTYTVEHARFWFTPDGSGWKKAEGDTVLENIYTQSIVWYLEKKGLLK